MRKKNKMEKKRNQLGKKICDQLRLKFFTDSTNARQFTIMELHSSPSHPSGLTKTLNLVRSWALLPSSSWSWGQSMVYLVTCLTLSDLVAMTIMRPSPPKPTPRLLWVPPEVRNMIYKLKFDLHLDVLICSTPPATTRRQIFNYAVPQVRRKCSSVSTTHLRRSLHNPLL